MPTTDIDLIALARSIALAAFSSVLQAAVLASAGLYLGKRRLLTPAGAKVISTLSMQITIPCMLFSKVLPSVDLRLLHAAWPMLVLPFVFVSIGAVVGYLTTLVCRPPREFRNGMIAAIAFGNSTGMPIVILSVLDRQIGFLYAMGSNIDSSPSPEVIRVTDPVVYLSVYLLTYPLCQWTFGSLLLGVDPAGAIQQIQAAASARPSAVAEAAGASPVAAAAAKPACDSSSSEGMPPNPSFLDALVAGEVVAETSLPPQGVGRWTSSSSRPASVRQSVNFGGGGGYDEPLLPTDDKVEMSAFGRADRSLAASLRDRANACAQLLPVLAKKMLVPPVIGVLLGLVLSGFAPSYWLFCGGTYGERLGKDQRCPQDGALLGFLFNGISTLGQAAVPLNLILLGNGLSKGPDWQALPMRCNVGIVCAKLLAMPTISLLLMVTLNLTLGSRGAGWFGIKAPYDEVFFLAAVAVTATPTANNIVVMTEMGGGDKRSMSTAVFSQYAVAPVVLTFTLTLIVLVLHTLG